MTSAATISDPTTSAGPARRCVLLRHDLPDGSQHIDWMLSKPGVPVDSHSTLITFQLPAAVHTLPVGSSMPAKRIADHRCIYLDYQGPISNGRGTVQRIAQGTILGWHMPDQCTWSIDLHWRGTPEGSGQRVQVCRDAQAGNGASWTVRCVVFLRNGDCVDSPKEAED